MTRRPETLLLLLLLLQLLLDVFLVLMEMWLRIQLLLLLELLLWLDRRRKVLIHSVLLLASHVVDSGATSTTQTAATMRLTCRL
jgi:uncharacterized membrane protein